MWCIVILRPVTCLVRLPDFKTSTGLYEVLLDYGERILGLPSADYFSQVHT